MAVDLADLFDALGTADVFDLGQPLEAGMPCSPNHPGFRMALIRRHGDRVGPDGGSGANELIVTGGHVGTHLDAFSHAARDGRLFGGHDALAASVGGRFTVHGVETVAPFLTRGLLADVPALKGVSRLEPGYGITERDVAAALGPLAIRPGDVVLVRSGWPQLYGDAAAYLGAATGVPGITESAARWLADQGVRAVGSDTTATDRIAPGAGHSRLPAHGVLLVERGVHIIEVMDLEGLAARGVREFLFVAIPLKIVGATGSPVRPLAVAFGSVPA
ncbi:cyclase family protein [Actinomadura rayongensis]|uniref:Cyclase family protein n=1 Tax=Actinomadura rayongensis TaxID=1429076 RepID=A0A6I4WAE9_9ACTN|nr:cyclase family protein [Actinomadura rayongensis]MXQ67849.1 cyclase family protein [Actinomadura rayongensis]